VVSIVVGPTESKRIIGGMWVGEGWVWTELMVLLCTWASVIVLEWAVGGHAFNWTRVGLAKDNKTRKIFRVDINGGGRAFFLFFFLFFLLLPQ